MALGDGRRNKILSQVQAKVGEPVVCAALLSPKGMTGARMGGGLIGQAVHSSSQTVAPGFAASNCLAVTDSGLYVFSASENFGIKVQDQIGYWPWGAFGAVTQPGSITQFLYLYWNDGSVSQLEAATMTTASRSASARMRRACCSPSARISVASCWRSVCIRS